MLQCAGRLSEKAYYIKEINKNVYSLEEINYFVYNHMNFVYREFFCEALFVYMEEELERPDLGRQLRIMVQAGADLKALITYLLKESYYYDSQDLAKITGFVTNINNISDPERKKMEGDNLFKERKYSAAKSVYLGILDEAGGAPSGEFFADTAFRAGLCEANLFLCRNACAYFNMAYDIFPKDDYAKACVYISIVFEDEEELLRTIIRYRVSDEALEKIRGNISHLKKGVLNSENFSEFVLNINDSRAAASLAAGFKDEYYRMTE